MNRELDARHRHASQAAAADDERGDADQFVLTARDADQRIAAVGAGVAAIPRVEEVEGGEHRAPLHPVFEVPPLALERGHIGDGVNPGDGQPLVVAPGRRCRRRQ